MTAAVEKINVPGAPQPTARFSHVAIVEPGYRMVHIGGRNSKTRTVIRTANTPSENMLSRSGVPLACGTTTSYASLRNGHLGPSIHHHGEPVELSQML
jgi:hypothetical protein